MNAGLRVKKTRIFAEQTNASSETIRRKDRSIKDEREIEVCWLARGEIYSGIGGCQRTQRHACNPMHTLVPRRKQWRKIMHCGGAHCEPESCDIEFGQLRAFVPPLPWFDTFPFDVSVFFRPSYMQRCSGFEGGLKGRTLDSRPTGCFLSLSLSPFLHIAEGKYARKSDLSNIIHARRWARWIFESHCFRQLTLFSFLGINRILYISYKSKKIWCTKRWYRKPNVSWV